MILPYHAIDRAIKLPEQNTVAPDVWLKTNVILNGMACGS